MSKDHFLIIFSLFNLIESYLKFNFPSYLNLEMRKIPCSKIKKFLQKLKSYN